MVKLVILMLIIHSGMGQYYNDDDNNGKKIFLLVKKQKKKRLICYHEITGDGESKDFYNKISLSIPPSFSLIYKNGTFNRIIDAKTGFTGTNNIPSFPLCTYDKVVQPMDGLLEDLLLVAILYNPPSQHFFL